jgi:signal transduction histidine kinase
VEICVADNGIGFDEKDNEKIFGLFHRLHGKSKFEGTGLGLSICKKIVDKHSGTIIAKSKIGEGSQFTIQLPQ